MSIEPEVTTEQPKREIISPIQSNNDWCDWVAKLPLQGMAKALAAQCQWSATTGDTVHIICNAKQSALLNTNSETRLLLALNQVLPDAHQLKISLGETSDTPKQRQLATQSALLQQTHTQLAKDPGVMALQKHLSATLDSITLHAETANKL